MDSLGPPLHRLLCGSRDLGTHDGRDYVVPFRLGPERSISPIWLLYGVRDWILGVSLLVGWLCLVQEGKSK